MHAETEFGNLADNKIMGQNLNFYPHVNSRIFFLIKNIFSSSQMTFKLHWVKYKKIAFAKVINNIKLNCKTFQLTSISCFSKYFQTAVFFKNLFWNSNH